MSWELLDELARGFLAAVGLFWLLRVAIPEFLRRLIDRYDKRPSELEES